MEMETFIRVLLQKWRIIMSIFIITFVASVFFTLRQPRIYEAKATFVAKLTPVFENNRDFANVLDILSSRVEISSTYAEIADSQRLHTLAMQKLGISPENRANLSASSRLIAGTNVIEIAVQGTDPVLARDFANALGESTIEYVQSLYQTFTLSPLDEATTPQDPVQPKVALNLILGGVLGLVLGTFIALLTHYFQTMGKNPKYSPEKEGVGESPSDSDISLMKLRQDIVVLQEKFEDASHALNQIQAAINRSNSNTDDVKSAEHDLEERFGENNRDGVKVNLGKDET